MTRVSPSVSFLDISPAKAGGEFGASLPRAAVSPPPRIGGEFGTRLRPASASPPQKSGGARPRKRCGAVVLAAGEATRMGVAKPALPFGGSTMVGTVVDSARAAELTPIVVVTGFHSDTVEAVVPAIARIARNPEPGRGNMSSLLVGIDAVGDVDAVVILVSDMPGVTVESIVAVCAGLREGEHDVAWTHYTDGRGHPIAIAASAVPAIRELSGPKALWPYFDELDPDATFEVVIDGPKPVDVNSPADYRSLSDAGGSSDTLEP